MKKLNKIKNGLFKRNASILNYGLKTGLSILKNKNDPKKILESIIGVDPQKFVDDLSHYKGSITKAGQLISQYGEYYFSESVNEKLRLLQSSTHFLEFEVIKKQLSATAHSHFDISETPLAAASIGQVHSAVHKENQNEVIFKIQYLGIEKAIGADMYFIKILAKMLNIFPSSIDTSEVFLEIEDVLRKEMDYKREISLMNKYKSLLDDSFFKIPQVHDQYSNNTSICMDRVYGIHINQVPILEENKEQRNKLGMKLFELFLKEIFVYSLVQTDSHGGNYLVSEDLASTYLIDFGACLEFDSEVLNFYKGFLTSSYELDRESFFKIQDEFSKYAKANLEIDKDLLWEYITLLSSPLRSNDYDWGETDLPDQLIKYGEKLRKTIKIDKIPSQFIFLDRKILGVFTIMKNLKSRFDVKKCFLGYTPPFRNINTL
ncbi:AarF/UbiB family protein [Halobacteriovorax sp. HLS]|uniref:AarF/UbiB family protein n=1 Tax=Halobacteriovorax sp. HLS TaxID=2234000 RepID=UPI000FDA6BCC|nr:AarF/UbiB family protein [Halobacteriovorax sp. HLS]